MLVRSNSYLNLLRKAKRYDWYKGVECWEKKDGKYKLHVFTLILDNEELLSKVWEPLTNDVAFHVQAKLKKKAERWNLFIFYLVKGKISETLHHDIEYDRYSTRKKVIENLTDKIDESYLKKVIENELIPFKLIA